MYLLKIDERKQPIIKEIIPKTKSNTNSTGPLLKKQSLKSISKDTPQKINSYSSKSTFNQPKQKEYSSISTNTTSSINIQNKKSSISSLSSALKSNNNNNQYSRGKSHSLSEISEISASIGDDDEWDDDFLADVDLDKVIYFIILVLYEF